MKTILQHFVVLLSVLVLCFAVTGCDARCDIQNEYESKYCDNGYYIYNYMPSTCCDGSVFYYECNTCTCYGSQPICTQMECYYDSTYHRYFVGNSNNGDNNKDKSKGFRQSDIWETWG